MTDLDELFHKISELSTQVENLVVDENEEECATLLSQRQVLLEDLSHQVSVLTQDQQNPTLLKQYQDFIQALIVRDNTAIKKVLDAKNQLTSKLVLRVKTKKALTAYQKFNI